MEQKVLIHNITDVVCPEHALIITVHLYNVLQTVWIRNLIFDETTNHFNKFMSDQKLMKIYKIMELSNIPSNSIFYKLEEIKIKRNDEVEDSAAREIYFLF